MNQSDLKSNLQKRKENKDLLERQRLTIKTFHVTSLWLLHNGWLHKSINAAQPLLSRTALIMPVSINPARIVNPRYSGPSMTLLPLNEASHQVAFNIIPRLSLVSKVT